jgi:nitroreductase
LARPGQLVGAKAAPGGWHFVAVTGREQLTGLAKAWEPGGRHIAGSAATIVLVAQEPEDQRHHDWLLYDIGQATAFIMLAAADLGIGSGHSAVGDQQQAQRVLGCPGGYLAVYMIGRATPGRQATPPAPQTAPPAVRRNRALATLVTRHTCSSC